MTMPVARRRAPTRWMEPPPIREAEARALADALGLPRPVAALLAARGYGEPQAAKRFLRPQLDQLLHPRLDPKAKRNVLTKGLPASPGAASGVVVFSADEAEAPPMPE